MFAPAQLDRGRAWFGRSAVALVVVASVVAVPLAPAVAEAGRPAGAAHVKRTRTASPTRLVTTRRGTFATRALWPRDDFAIVVQPGRAHGGPSPDLDRRGPLAIKTFPAWARKRFKVERANLEALRGVPGLPELVDVGESDGRPFLVTRWQGRSLAEWTQASRPSVTRAVDVARAAGRILADMHARGFLHLDVKPHNLMIGTGGKVSVIDVGSAARPRALHLRGGEGSTGFMAPEQYAGGFRSPATDVYGLASTLVSLIQHGEIPFAGAGDATRQLRARMHGDRAALRDVADPALRAILSRALEPERGRRYPTMTAFVEALDAWRVTRAR